MVFCNVRVLVHKDEFALLSTGLNVYVGLTLQAFTMSNVESHPIVYELATGQTGFSNKALGITNGSKL